MSFADVVDCFLRDNAQVRSLQRRITACKVQGENRMAILRIFQANSLFRSRGGELEMIVTLNNIAST